MNKNETINKLAVFASGRGSNLKSLIEAQKNEQFKAKIELVFSDNINAKALSIAKENNIFTESLDRKNFDNKEDFNKAILDILNRYKIEAIVLAGYMRILSPIIVNQYKYKILNIHPSLLPSFPGLDPQKKAIEYGVKVSGATVHFVDEGVDSGPIIIQMPVPVLDNDTENTLSKRILEQEHIIYPKAVDLFTSGKLTIKDRVVIINNI